MGKFRNELEEKLKNKDNDIEEWLNEVYKLDRGAARTVISHLDEQRKLCGFIPSDTNLLVEGYIDNRGRNGAMFISHLEGG